MLLHAFIDGNRAEILARCAQRMKSSAPAWDVADLTVGFEDFIDEVVRALQRDAGLDVTSPIPGKSDAALRHAAHLQAGGYPIANLATDFGSLSDVMGQLATERGETFGPREYQVFNQCIDTVIATALEQYWNQTREQLALDETERLGFLAHELRNSLSSARAAFAILKRGQLTAGSRTGDVLERSLGRLERLIDQALTTVRLHGRVELQLERLCVAKLLRDVVESAVLERGIRIRVDADDTVEVTADEKLLVSAVGNLVHNALKFTYPNGTVVLRAYAREGSAMIEIEDECGGIPAGHERDLFKPFVQKGADRRGLGLGLAITRDAVQAHGGELSLRNLPGKGCIFAIALAPPA